MATIPDNLNAEIVLGTVTSLQEAASWLKYTYLHVRMLMNPEVQILSPPVQSNFFQDRNLTVKNRFERHFD